jgi:hypothetical protein
MILDKGRALICAGVFCLAAAVGSAQAAQVYAGCAQPGPIGKVWYVDPVNGKTPAAGGNGSQTAPWDSLQGVVSSGPPAGYPRPLLSSIPYFHRQPLPGTTQRVYADQLGSPPVQPGDEILLMGGQYGDIAIGAYGVEATNAAFVTVGAFPGQTPVLSTLYIRSTNKWVFNGVKVQSLRGTGTNATKQVLVTVADVGAAYPTSDIILVNMLISSFDSTSGWTQAQWLAQAREGGIYVTGSENGADTTCVSVTNLHMMNVVFGAAVMGNKMLFSGNEIDHFGDDGIDYAASNILITKNYIHDDLNVGNGAHMDGMQGYPGRPVAPGKYGTFSNVVIDSNRIIRQTDPNLPFPTYLQGIDAFDGDWTNLTVTNNVVVTSSCWGIGYASVHGGKFINNTVLDDGSDVGTKNPAGRIVCRPSVAVGDKTHQGLPSNDVIIRNNIANGLSIYNVNPNMTMDHNICLTIEGKCGIVTYENGKPKWGIYKPGVYANHNIIERRGGEGMFVSFDPAKFVFDLRLRPGVAATGAGSPTDAPSVDITGAPRGSSIDAGAYQHSPGK